MTNGRRIGKASYAPARSCAALIVQLGGPSQPQLRTRLAYSNVYTTHDSTRAACVYPGLLIKLSVKLYIKVGGRGMHWCAWIMYPSTY